MPSSRQKPQGLPAAPPVHALPPRWTPEGHEDLAAFLAANASGPVALSAAALTRVDCMMLQVLLSAARTRRARGFDLPLLDQPPAVAETLALLGVGPDHLAGRV